jgi:hypothetical protein
MGAAEPEPRKETERETDTHETERTTEQPKREENKDAPAVGEDD